MKKILLVFLLCATLVFGSCGLKEGIVKSRTVSDISQYLQSLDKDFTVKGRGFEGTGRLTYSPDSISVKMTSPKALENVEITIRNDIVSFSVGGLYIEKNAGSFPDGGFLKSVSAALKSACENCNAQKTENGFTVSGATVLGTFEMTFDEEKELTGIVFPEREVEIEFL